LPPDFHDQPARNTKTPQLHRYVDLDSRTLDRNDAIVLKFVTQGRVGMKIQGRLLGGTIVPYTPTPPIFTVPRVLLGLLLAIVIVLGINRFGAFQQNNCALSLAPVNISGSTAFFDTVQSQANAYHQGCPFVMLNVQSSDSAAGLTQLEQKHLDIADSEISPKEAGYNYTDLTEHQVAVIVFTIVINKQVTGITSLSQDDITKIYTGQYRNWKQVNGPDMPIVLYSRPSGSGTQAAFTRYVLQRPANAIQITVSSTQEVINGVGSTRGAIGYVDLGSADQATDTVTAININGNAPTPGLVENNKYPFWSIERMYTRQDANNPLTPSFITYATNNIRTNNTFINITEMPPSVRAKHE
jgi:phosphate transport system substrate-binding protein